MLQQPRRMTETFLNWRELSMSIVQGLMITAGVLLVYQWAVHNGKDEPITRAMVFCALIFANIFLSLVNRSFVYSVFESFRNRNKLFPLITGATLVLLAVIIYVPPVAAFFGVRALSSGELGCSLLVAAVAVLWFELYKAIKYRTLRRETSRNLV